MSFTVHVDDNFDYMNRSGALHPIAEYDTLQEAITACKKIVEESLSRLHQPGMNAATLYARYISFGDDPWVGGGSTVPFSAWDYAERRCAEICTPPCNKDDGISV